MSNLPFNIRGDIARLVEKQQNAIPVTNPTIELNIESLPGDYTEGGYQLTKDINYVSYAGGIVRLPELNQQLIGRIFRIRNDTADILTVVPYFNQFYEGLTDVLTVSAFSSVTLIGVTYNNWKLF